MDRQPTARPSARPPAHGAAWLCSGPQDLSTALGHLAAEAHPTWAASRTETLRFYDTYDWDLAFAGLALVEQGTSLRLCPAGRWCAPQAIARQRPARAAGGNGAELAQGPAVSAVAARVGERRLLPVGEIRREVTSGALRDAAGQPLARVRLEVYRRGPGRGRTQFTLVRIQAVTRRGGAVPVPGLGGALTAAGLERLSAARLQGLQLQLLGVPGRQVLKPRYLGRVREAAGVAVPTTALALLAALRRCEAGILANVDAECLHQYRVQLRRLRALLSLLRRALPEPLAAPVRADLAALARRSNRLRDLDVMLQEEHAYGNLVPEVLQPGLAHAFVTARRRRGLERGRLVRYLRSTAYAQLLQRLQQALEAPVPGDAAPAAGVPIRRLVRQRLRKLYARLVDAVAALPAKAPPAEYHRIRVQCKRLRYLLDLFRDVLRRRPTALLMRRLQALQSLLGGMNDLAMQRSHLEELLRQGRETAGPGAPDSPPLMRLWAQLERRRAALGRRARAMLLRFCSRRMASCVRRA